ncbi:MAG TPA: alpha/beta hydrolase, partial [Kineosporiaceae bacterium]|nr:alpha/beta hydrolase [Kineosporiaceae bacterium]
MWILLVVVSIVAGLVVVVLAGALLTRYVVRTPAFRDSDGRVVSGSIAEFRRLRLGGCSQAVLIRGRSAENPVLLFLHAGPGFSEMGLCRNVNAALEDHYVVVHWDQRGTGKSYSPFISAQTMTVGQLVQDTHELTEYLKRRFGKDRIILVGHSWGAGLGLVVAARHPDDYSALVCMGQPVVPLDSDRLSYHHTLDQARTVGNTKAVKELERVDGYWQRDGDAYVSGMMIQKRWVQRFGGMLHGQRGMSPLIRRMLSREVTLFDIPAAQLGSSFNLRTLAPLAYRINLFRAVPELQVPYLLLQGRHDINTYPTLVQE